MRPQNPQLGGAPVVAPAARKKCKRRESTIIDNSASELETGLTDLGACGPCKLSCHKCKPQVGTKGLVCRLCIKRKTKCDPPSAVAQAIINGCKKKHLIEDVIERLNNTSRTQEEFNTAIRDFMYNTDTVLRTAKSISHPSASTYLQFHSLPRPPEASMPSGSSVASGATSSVSSLGVSHMMLDNAGIAGPSEPLPKYEETEASNVSVMDIVRSQVRVGMEVAWKGETTKRRDETRRVRYGWRDKGAWARK
ncbi:hypothetical protein EDB83DRAFT_2324578 [Lactarius deliciosus]|nr:hypothetical protein EDB83DRAFT_2324578 [Lactarius deliciosus]